MGYKLAGFNVLGGVEIDKKMSQIYIHNHNPKYFYTEDLRLFNKREALPKELYNLDILDGSPPCSNFSLAGNKEKDWGINKKFTEGQTEQVLDDLVFAFCETINKLQPKVFVLENVVGIIMGNSLIYANKIVETCKKNGYKVLIFKLSAAFMGVPQDRRRVFFIGIRNDMQTKNLTLKFNEKPIPFSQVEKRVKTSIGKPLTGQVLKYWKLTPAGYPLSKSHPKGSFFNDIKTHPNKVINTIRASGSPLHHTHPNEISDECMILGSSFPQDYAFLDSPIKFVVGMSVPPLMMGKIAEQIRKQVFNK